MNTSEIFDSTTFGPTLMKSAGPIAAKHFGIALEADVPYEEVGTEAEKLIRNIAIMSARLLSNMDELDQVILFMRVTPVGIESLYKGSIPVSDYYKYQYDNYIIRLSTTLDLCGKIGHLVYETGKKDINANAGSFANYAQKHAPQPFEALSALQHYLRQYTDRRHMKVHQGESIENRFAKITFWKELSQSFKMEGVAENPLLQEHTENQIKEATDEIAQILPGMAQLVMIFLETLVDQLKIVIAKA